MEAKGSDVRLLELSLQPTKLARQAGSTTYTWAYPRLLFGQPVRLDVLGIAPIDRLGELTWLGPLSVLVFGLMVGLVVHAASVPRFDLWMLLLTVGTFAGAYPLMYFAQEYIALGPAVLISAGFALTVIGVLAVSLLGVWLALGGVLLPATAILAVTLTAAIWPALQGLLLTVELLGFFIAAMLLLARIRAAAIAPPAGGQEIAAHPTNWHDPSRPAGSAESAGAGFTPRQHPSILGHGRSISKRSRAPAVKIAAQPGDRRGACAGRRARRCRARSRRCGSRAPRRSPGWPRSGRRRST